MPSKKTPTLRTVSAKDYEVEWDARKNACVFRHKSGKGGELGCGVSDNVAVFSGVGRVIVLAVNYPARYACIETYTNEEGPDELVFAEPKDIDKFFGDDFASVSPKKIAERLAAEL
jgi:hypothetical protein